MSKKILVVEDDPTTAEYVANGLEQNGFIVDPPNCSMCLGIASRKAGKGEVWLSSQNRNFENRQGPKTRTHLVSPATAAATAIVGRIADVRQLPGRP